MNMGLFDYVTAFKGKAIGGGGDMQQTRHAASCFVGWWRDGHRDKGEGKSIQSITEINVSDGSNHRSTGTEIKINVALKLGLETKIKL